MARLKVDSKSIDSVQLGTYEAIVRVAMINKVPFIVVGASARDLVMHHAYGAPVQRATRDIDLAVQVQTWKDFEQICLSLVEEGYTRTGIVHRLCGPHGIPLDIIPFGPIESENSTIAWPPTSDVKMGVVGFQEAFKNADIVVVDQEPILELPVASPQGLVLLKLVSWSERDAQARRKDAADIVYLLSNHENILGMMDRLYGQHEAVLEAYSWDTRLSGAHVLGLGVAQITSTPTLLFLKNLLNEDQLANLERDAGSSAGDVTGKVLAAFSEGLFNPKEPDV
jgi:predicted nucleotidyltransferase